jgi:hypothetical protein
MSKEQALHLLVAEAFNKAEAMEMESSYLIAVQLCSYFTGTLKFMILEKDLKRRKMAI